MAVTLMMLMAGTSPTWAWWSYDETHDDPGGGTYTFRSQLWGSKFDFNAARYFETHMSFDMNSHCYLLLSAKTSSLACTCMHAHASLEK